VRLLEIPITSDLIVAQSIGLSEARFDGHEITGSNRAPMKAGGAWSYATPGAALPVKM